MVAAEPRLSCRACGGEAAPHDSDLAPSCLWHDCSLMTWDIPLGTNIAHADFHQLSFLPSSALPTSSDTFCDLPSRSYISNRSCIRPLSHLATAGSSSATVGYFEISMWRRLRWQTYDIFRFDRWLFFHSVTGRHDCPLQVASTLYTWPYSSLASRVQLKTSSAA